MRKPKDSKTVKQMKPAEPAAEDDGGETSPEAKPKTESEAKSKTEPEAKSKTEPEAKPKAEPEAKPKAEPEAQAEPVAAGALAQNEAPHDDLPHDEPAPEDLPPEDHARDEEHEHRSLAATVLMVLIGIIFIASLTLWAAPKLAPNLPAGVAKYLLPGQIDTESRLVGLDNAVAAATAKSDAAIAALNAEIAALGTRLDAAAEARQGDASQTESAIAAAQSAADAAADSAAADAASLAARLDAIEAGLASLSDEFGAVSTALADAGTGEGATPPEIAAAIAALGARLDSLAASVEGGTTAEALEAALEARIAALATRLDAVESSAADARDVQSEALDEASSAIRQARLQAAVDVLASRLTGGLPYAAKLDEIAALASIAPPAPLAAGAATGLTTAAALEVSFGRHAQAAVAADVQASAGEGTGLQALGWLRAQVTGRPVAEIEGDSVGAVISRIAARVEEGKLTEALAEAETLPEHAQAGLGRWLDQLHARIAADAALADWRTQIGAGG
ncbi:MAG: hypothetical protein ACU0B1_12250 [Thermohalobaculum sp.]